MKKTYFISGIDTGIGKTVATGLMARSLRARGTDVITVKLAQTGNDGFSEDIDAHRLIAGGETFYEDKLGLTAPQIFKFPASPCLAARREGRKVDLARIEMCVKACAEHHEVTLVESAGGLDVPLTEDVLSADFATSQGWPLILVTCGRLGSINHTLLSLEAARGRGMEVAGVIHDWHPDADPEIDADAVETTKSYLARFGWPSAPVIRIPQVAGQDWPDIDFSEIFS